MRRPWSRQPCSKRREIIRCEPLTPIGAASAVSGEPQLPSAFTHRGETIEVRAVLRTWRSTKTDRGDVYVKRHWFEFESGDRRLMTVYFDRDAKRNKPAWWLYSIAAPQREP